MNLRKRLENLERRFGGGDVLTLVMRDGSRKLIPLRGRDGVLDLFQRCLGDAHCAEAELIRASIAQIDSSGGRMGELIWSLLNSPVESHEEMNRGSDSDGI